MPVEVLNPQSPIEWSIDYEAEGFVGVEEVGGTTVAVSRDGTYHYDGAMWSRVADGIDAYDISLAADGSLFALKGFTVYRQDGSAWNTVRTFQSNSEYWSVPAVWAHSSNDVFVVTTEDFEAGGYYYWTENTLHHFDGTSWTAIQSFGSSNAPRDMWGTSAKSVYIACSDGLYHYDGSTVSKVDAAGTAALRTIGGTSDSDLFAIRTDESVLLFDGVASSSLPAPPARDLRAARRIAGDLFVCGYEGAVFRNVGSGWLSMATGSADHFMGIGGTTAADIFAVGTGGILQRNDGVWRRTRGGTTAPLRDIWVASTGEVFIVGDKGVIEVRDAAGWRPIGFGGSFVPLLGVAGTSRDNVYAVGSGGLILHYNGSEWRAMASGTTVSLVGIWASEGTAVAVGENTILKLENDLWTPMAAQMPARFKLQDVWGADNGDMFAVGYVTFEYEGTILGYDGSMWHPVDSEVRKRMFGVWGFAPDDVFAVGESGPQDGPTRFWAGSIYHYDGVAWTRMQVTEDIASLYAVWGASRDNLIALGGSGVTLYDGASWTTEVSEGLDASGLDRLHAAEGTDVFGLGRKGVVRLKFQP